MLEVIVCSVEEAMQAYKAGADRIELVSAIHEGGLTPAFSLVEQILSSVPIRTHVMVRPHSQSFCYDSSVVDVMRKDIERIRQLGAHGVVLGALTPNGQIDKGTLTRLVDAAEGMSITFHRAFDEVDNQEEALEQLLTFQTIDRLLTSGGKPSALDAVREIRDLVKATEGSHLTVLAGSGLTVQSLLEFIRDTGVKEVHFGKGVRVDEQSDAPIDARKIHQVKQLLNASRRGDIK